MAPKKRRFRSWKEFCDRWEANCEIEEMASGMIDALRDSELSRWEGSWYQELTSFLIEVIEDEYPALGEKIRRKAIEYLLEISERLRGPRLTGLPGIYLWTEPTQRLLVFLGENPPIDKLQKKIRDFLRTIVEIHVLVEEVKVRSLVRALLRYQMHKVVEIYFVQKRVYDAIPPLFEAVVEQTVRSGLDPNKARLALDHLVVETDVITKRFFCRLDDHRALRLLLVLEEEYRKEHGKPYELPGDDKEQRRSAAY